MAEEKKRSSFWTKPNKKWLLGIPLGGFVMLAIGAAGLQIMNTILHETSKTEFCLACHSHTVNIKPEYEASGHANNTVGVRAECAECHLPSMEDRWIHYVMRKMVVSLDIIPELQGKITDPADYEAHRAEMEKATWIEFRENDSEYCKHCHKAEHMVLENQGPMARRRHEMSMEKGGYTCIDCHQGLVHKLPEDWEKVWDEVVEETSGSRKGPELAAADD